MNRDASNVEDINIHHIGECVWLFCIASFEDWSNIFRTRSFTVCNNDRDFNESSESVAVLESIPSSSMTVSVLSERTGWLFTHGFPFLLPTFHQISTLEKTTSRQYSILSSLMNFHELRGI